MKKITMLSLAMLLVAATAFAQEKGETQFGLSGNLFTSYKGKASGSKSVSEITPSANFRYLMTNKIGLDGGLGIKKGNKYNTKIGKDLGINLMVGGRYYYYSKDKMRIDGGLNLTMGLGKGAKELNDKGKLTAPMSLKITAAELEYWPMEGGAITGDLFYDMHGLNLGDGGSNGFGVGLGVKIRLK